MPDYLDLQGRTWSSRNEVSESTWTKALMKSVASLLAELSTLRTRRPPCFPFALIALSTCNAVNECLHARGTPPCYTATYYKTRRAPLQAIGAESSIQAEQFPDFPPHLSDPGTLNLFLETWLLDSPTAADSPRQLIR